LREGFFFLSFFLSFFFLCPLASHASHNLPPKNTHTLKKLPSFFPSPLSPFHRYGIGQVYFRQEKWELAEYHFRRARALHPGSSVLATCLGAALARAGPARAAEAEAALADAVAADPRNPLARFERAALLASGGRTEAALAELEALKRVAPREAGVWFQAGRLHARAGRAGAARSHLAAALDLAPAAADAALIKAALDRLGRGGGGGGWESDGESDAEL
jgi:predicted Zn-dependent protease